MVRDEAARKEAEDIRAALASRHDETLASMRHDHSDFHKCTAQAFVARLLKVIETTYGFIRKETEKQKLLSESKYGRLESTVTQLTNDYMPEKNAEWAQIVSGKNLARSNNDYGGHSSHGGHGGHSSYGGHSRYAGHSSYGSHGGHGGHGGH